jgi:uncharacterized protein (DUF305 family)
MNETIKYGAVGLMGGVVLGIIIAPWFSQSDSPRLNSMIGQNIDKHFIEEMLPHHEGAIVMAELALELSKRPEIISLANEIIEAQKRENEQMSEWYSDWFGGTPSNALSIGEMGHGPMGMSMLGVEGDLETLKLANDFDLELISQMIPHHEMAIMMARMLVASTNRVEMKMLADNIITSQSQEIEIMRNWYREWSK